MLVWPSCWKALTFRVSQRAMARGGLSRISCTLYRFAGGRTHLLPYDLGSS